MQLVENPPANAGDTGGVGSIPGSGRSPGEGNGNPLQYSCLENPMDSGPRVTISQTRLSSTQTHVPRIVLSPLPVLLLLLLLLLLHVNAHKKPVR